jgi:UDP-N-acetylmuramoyl-L-alanyl-D-glutamate--2,6-diaminopimelate ligase
MKVIAVTGTDGKTTVTSLVEAALQEAGVTAGRIGTTGVAIDGRDLPSALTTPEAPQLQALFRRMREAGVQVVALEASSVGLVRHRLVGTPFHLAVFTNLSRDHLDFHGDMASYQQAKAQLFRMVRPGGHVPRALLCGDDPAWRTMDPPEDHWLYGFSEHCDVRIVDWRATAGGTRLTLQTPQGSAQVDSALVGRFNAQNLAAALGCCLLVGLSLEQAARALSAVPGVPGRMERIANERDLLVVVDYAHTPKALASVLQTLREVTPGRLCVVFGCGGDRDAGKRPQMGHAAQAADVVVVTSDNPRSEDPQSIVDAVRAGMDREPDQVQLDRRTAIAWALGQAQAGDTVLIAGKGHETTQEIGGVAHPFDDRQVARSLLEAA